MNYKHRTTDFIAPEANDVKEVIKYLYTDEFREFSINIFINFLYLIVFEEITAQPFLDNYYFVFEIGLSISNIRYRYQFI